MHRLRQLLLGLLAFGALATAADLILVEHYADVWQLAPFLLIGITLPVALWAVVAPSPTALRSLRAAMTLLIGGGIAGLWLHLAANVEFEREVAPERAGVDLFWNAIKGAAPPTLAPAALIHLGLLGLAATYGQLRDEGDDR